jgi:hypothetical protein
MIARVLAFTVVMIIVGVALGYVFLTTVSDDSPGGSAPGRGVPATPRAVPATSTATATMTAPAR